MLKTLTKHGNSYALIIDRAILELLKITPETPLEVSTDGKTLTIAPLADAKRRARVVAALDRTNRRHGRALRKLAE
ncbi:MAG: AbrB/MazE/SpoVT family DNA-binding domain-containing protein [Phycisphaerae bacterium]